MHYILSLYYVVCIYLLSYDSFSTVALSVLIFLLQYFYVLACTTKHETQPFQHCVYCKKMTPQHYIHCKECKKCVSIDYEHCNMLKRCTSRLNITRYRWCVYVFEIYLLFLLSVWTMVSVHLLPLLFLHWCTMAYLWYKRE